MYIVGMLAECILVQADITYYASLYMYIQEVKCAHKHVNRPTQSMKIHHVAKEINYYQSNHKYANHLVISTKISFILLQNLQTRS